MLVIDGSESHNSLDNVVEYGVRIFDKQPLAQQIIIKYKRNPDKLRWALKPLFILHILSTQAKVIYVDNDIYFYNNPGFLFDKLDECDVLLTPHFYPSSPIKNQNWLEANYRVGLYNAGFLGATVNAEAALIWWAKCCLYNLKKAYWRGLFDDQKYLDLLPIKFEGVHVIKHVGCNLAGWNDEDAGFLREENGNILINQKYPIVFIHYAALSMQKFSDPNHALHQEYEVYQKRLLQYSSNYKNNVIQISWYQIFAYLHYTRWRIARLFE